MSGTSTIPTVTLKPRRALPFFSRHPWLFTGAIGAVSGMPDTGDEVIVRANDGQFVARGLFNPQSNIRVRLYSWKEEEPLDESFWHGQVDAALRLREKLFGGSPEWGACRLIYSESDGLSGLTVDRYGDWLTLQWTGAALAKRQSILVDALQQRLKPRGIWLRTERGILEQEGLALEDGLVAGEEPPPQIEVEEHGRRFGVDLKSGQKTGFYYDQRDNRQAPGRYVRGGRMLDVCCYTGGFAIQAAASGAAREVVAVDSSATALSQAGENAERNGVRSMIRFEQADMFEFLSTCVEQGDRYDIVVLDPPKMARARGGLPRALKAYVRLNALAMQTLNPDGILLTCSCSGHVLREDFEQVVANAGLEAGRRVQILEARGQAADHPVAASCLETSYLKCLICRVL